MSEKDESKVAVITGASSGIGAQVARALGGAGFRLVLNGRSQQKLQAVADEIVAPRVVVACDLRDPLSAQKLLSSAIENFGRCDVCFNNGGIIEVGPIETIDIERVCEMVQVNVEAAFRIAYTFLKHFVCEGKGHLINTSSVMGTKVRPTGGAYAATKFAIEALSESLRVELSKTDVQVSCIEPGLVRTGFHDRWQVHPTESMGIAEPLTPADIARMVLFVLDQPAHVRIPRLMVLPRGHEI
jgi:NADP-dependent 3-hydroxy acid dehydrogenase YdfG